MKNLFQVGELKNNFDLEFEPCQLLYKGAWFEKTQAHCFFVETPSEKNLKEYWIKISNFLALEFQNNLENEFERWNIYLFFLISFEINNDLKYIIENDSFSSRKIIITQGQDIESIIKEHVLNTDLNIQVELVSEEAPLTADPILWEALKGVMPKTKITDEIKTTLDLIIEKITLSHL